MEFSMQTAGKFFFWVFPVLVLAGIIEGLFYSRMRQKAFSWKASAASLGVAIGHRLAGIALGEIVILQFARIHAHRLSDIPANTWWGVILLFLGSEFCYYWEHRLSHEIRWFWASHAVHHSPEQLTLSAAYRLGWTGAISGMGLIFAPLVIVGFSSTAVFSMLGVNLLYQFWLHTELLPSMGWFDLIFNSPSNHRVHHARNAQYLDKNYGGILMIFDRIFGTYEPERADIPIKYGLYGHAPSHNPFVIALGEWVDIAHDVMKARNLHDLFHFIFGRPGWRPKPIETTRCHDI